MRPVRRARRPSPGPLTTAVDGPLTDYARRCVARSAIPTLDAELLERALTHRSYAYENGGLPTNERLEFLGDSVLGVVVTETLYRTHPDLSEGRLAKLRAAVVNARALAEVGRTIGLGEHIKLGRGEETTGGRDKASILSDTVEAVIGAVYLSGGFESSAAGRAPALRPADRGGLGARRRPGLEDLLQELSAEHGLGVPEYLIEDEGPDHVKTFTAQVRVGEQPLRQRRRPLQEGGRAAGRRDGVRRARGIARRPRRPSPATDVDRPTLTPRVPELPEVEIVRAASSATSSAARIELGRRCSTRVRYAATSRGPAGFAAALTGRRFEAARRRGKYLWLPLDNGDALLGHLGMSGQLLVQPPGAPRRAPPAGPLRAAAATAP